jgi:hypothetical protein
MITCVLAVDKSRDHLCLEQTMTYPFLCYGAELFTSVPAEKNDDRLPLPGTEVGTV